jgi:phage tail P2-like protein
MRTSLLPPNATKLERALEHGARPEPLATPAAVIDDPHACPAELLPWLAYGLSVDTWDADWSEEAKRDAVARSIEMHRLKGTRLSVETVVARFDALASLVEWHEASPRRQANTFEVVVPMVTPDGVAPGGRRATGEFAEAIIREVARVKPLREHMELVQSIACGGFIGVQSVARMFAEVRRDVALTIDESPRWASYLQTEDGEPLEDATGTFLETAP